MKKTAIFLLLAQASCASTSEIVELGYWRLTTDERCELKLDNEYLNPSKYAEGLLKRIPTARTIELRASRDMPYVCMGSAIYAMQRAGLTKIKFVAPK